MNAADVPLKAPFPYFGGKRAVADLVWSRFGDDVSNYVEPFAGSCAVLLARPRPFGGVETVNDCNAYVTNFWRAASRDPEAVVAACDWPVNELDLHSRHRWLVLSPEAIAFREKMRHDPDHFDPKIAGWWVWGACCWIGGEWCRYRDGPTRRPVLSNDGEGVNGGPVEWEQTPHLGGNNDTGRGMDSAARQPKRRPRVTRPPGVNGQSQQDPGGDAGVLGGVHQGLADGQPRGGEPSQQVPRLGARFGQPDLPGVLNPTESHRPQLADAFDVGRGVNSQGDLGTCAARRAWLLDWFGRLQDRLRLVRVCCGHWLRVCDSESVTTRLGTTAVFLDPPYPIKKKCGKKSRAGGLYQGDEAKALDDLRDEVLAYCLDRGPDPAMRLCVAAYDTDGYEVLVEQHGWKVEAWRAQGGYANRGENKANRERERLYFSPGCRFEAGLFDTLEDRP